MTRSRSSYRRASSTLVNVSAIRGKQKWRSFANRCTFSGPVIVRIAKANVASHQLRSKAVQSVVGRWRHQAIWRFGKLVQRHRAAEAGGQGGCAVGGQQRQAAGWCIIVGMYIQRRARPNPAVNLTCNGRRLAPGGGRFAHCTPPVTSHLPSQAGYC
jgi:hypothetical protein